MSEIIGRTAVVRISDGTARWRWLRGKCLRNFPGRVGNVGKFWAFGVFWGICIDLGGLGRFWVVFGKVCGFFVRVSYETCESIFFQSIIFLRGFQWRSWL